MDLVFKLHLICTAIMTGVIWVVQLVHYPSFKFIDEKKFLEFEKFHCKRITIIVLPIMLLEIASGIYLFYYVIDDIIFTVSLGILSIVWMSTFLIQSQIHESLLEDFSHEKITRLVHTNWVRTILWTTRLVTLYVITDQV